MVQINDELHQNVEMCQMQYGIQERRVCTLFSCTLQDNLDFS